MRARLCPLLVLAAALAAAATPGRLSAGEDAAPAELVTGKRLTPAGRHVGVGGFPCNLILSPDGRYVVVTAAGARGGLTVLSAADGKVVSRLPVEAGREDGSGLREGLYHGLAFAPGPGEPTLYVSRGAEGRIAVLRLEADGRLSPSRRFLQVPGAHVAGVGVAADRTRVYAVDRNPGGPGGAGALVELDAAAGTVLQRHAVGGFPHDVAVPSLGPAAGKAVFVASQREGLVSSVRLGTGGARPIATGPLSGHVLLSALQDRLYAASAGADTVSVIDTNTDGVIRTIELRPEISRRAPAVTPLGMALSPDGTRLYVALADLNAVAVVGTTNFRVQGYIPTGRYPTAVAASPDGRRLFVACAGGVAARVPNAPPAGAQVLTPAGTPQHVLSAAEGTVSVIETPGGPGLQRYTEAVLANNGLRARLEAPGHPRFRNPGVEHVVYVVLEGRTYDQVLGDLPQGEGDARLCAFPRAVTPNLHALAERFVLLDRFFCSGDVAADGWGWSVAGMVTPGTARDAAYAGAGGMSAADGEGMEGGVAPNLLGRPAVTTPPGGYFWDRVAEARLPYRNYGIFTGLSLVEARVPGAGPEDEGNQATRLNLIRHTDPNFRGYDLAYADSDAWVARDAPAPGQRLAYGKQGAKSRVAAWRHEFDGFVETGRFPRFSMLRFPRSRTAGARPGAPSPRAMMADADYAVGQVVEAISRSPFWAKTAIFVVCASADDGFDHVDARRSLCLVAGPYVRRGAVDSSHYTTPAVLRTMGLLLGLPPLNHYDATATPLGVFDERPENAAPFAAILPPAALVRETNPAR